MTRSTSCRYLAAHCYIKQGHHDQALVILGDQDPDHLIPSRHNSRRKLQNFDGPSTKHITLRNGSTTKRDRIEHSEERERDRGLEKDIKFEAAMCHLRGLCYAQRNAFERAKQSFVNAIKIDVQCFEAFDQLMKHSLLRPHEEVTLLEELDFDSIKAPDPSLSQEAAQFTKLLYTTRLSKYASPAAQSHATETLSTHYRLSSNPDLLLSRAETLYTQCRFDEALAITSSILDTSEASTSGEMPLAAELVTLGHPPSLYPLHLACLYETRKYTVLFLLSHTLSQHAPNEYYTYLAIGTYYLATYRIPEARRFFSKASLMNPHSAASWTGFAHTFAAEGEHDQAIAAYSTAVRLFQGSHLPQLFIGMQHLALKNMTTAWEHCFLAYQMSSGTVDQNRDPQEALFGAAHAARAAATMANTNLATELPSDGGDPLVLNELAVILYHQANLPAAVELFRRSLALAADLGCSPDAWVATRANLAHGLRKLGRLDESLAELDACLRVCTGETLGSARPGPARHGTSVGSMPGVSTTTGTSGGGGYGIIGAAAEDRTLIGSIQTTRGLVLLSLERPQDAVVALHEAVRVLGGDAAGGGMAGSLLSRAVEIWALERARRDVTPPYPYGNAHPVAQGITNLAPGGETDIAMTSDNDPFTAPGPSNTNATANANAHFSNTAANSQPHAPSTSQPHSQVHSQNPSFQEESRSTNEDTVDRILDTQADAFLSRLLSQPGKERDVGREGNGYEAGAGKGKEKEARPARRRRVGVGVGTGGKDTGSGR